MEPLSSSRSPGEFKFSPVSSSTHPTGAASNTALRARLRLHVSQLWALQRSACPLGFQGLEDRECRLVNFISFF